jgi:MSHA biogenesis protein MshE
MTGHLVLSTLHTNDAASTPMRLLDMGAPRYMVAMSLRMVLAQRLVRSVCDMCRVAHEPSAAEREWLTTEFGNMPDTKGCVHGVGCGQCNGTGFVGRTGVYEMLEMNQQLVQAANRGDAQAFSDAATRQMAGQTLKRHAAQLALAGVTTVDEAMHVSAQVDD